MFVWHLVCLFSLTLWKIDVNANPTKDHNLEGEESNYTPSRMTTGYQNTPHQEEVKRKGAAIKTTRIRRTPTGFSARDFHEDGFNRDFGHFSPVKRRPESDASGFYGDTFSNGFGEFETMKRKTPTYGYKATEKVGGDPRYYSQKLVGDGKRSPEMGGKSGFHSDVFSGGFGEFHPM